MGNGFGSIQQIKTSPFPRMSRRNDIFNRFYFECKIGAVICQNPLPTTALAKTSLISAERELWLIPNIRPFAEYDGLPGRLFYASQLSSMSGW